jgi:RNA polymerase sigma-70 factor (ECF subfamily)
MNSSSEGLSQPEGTRGAPARDDEPADSGGDVGRTGARPGTPPAARPDPAEARDPKGRQMSDAELAAEADLVQRATRGDRAAFRALYEQNVKIVYSFIAARVAPSQVEDLTAETFARAFERIESFEWRGVPIRAWLLRIAFHQVVGRSRRRSSSEVLTDDPTPPGIGSHEEALVDRLTDHQDVAAAMASLSPSQRAVVELRYFRELSVPETALVLELSEEAVRALTYRSLRSLRAALEASP